MLRRDAATNELVQQSKELSQDALGVSLAALEGLGQSAMSWFSSVRVSDCQTWQLVVVESNARHRS